MKQAIRLVHLLGLVLFLGSIFAFAVASSVPADGDLAGLAVARRVISRGTSVLTLPGLGLLVVSGLALLVVRRGSLRETWGRVMVGAGALIVTNAIVFVLPAVGSATALAESSATAGQLADGYQAAYMRESLAGGANILLAIMAMTAGEWRLGAKGDARRES